VRTPHSVTHGQACVSHVQKKNIQEKLFLFFHINKKTKGHKFNHKFFETFFQDYWCFYKKKSAFFTSTEITDNVMVRIYAVSCSRV